MNLKQTRISQGGAKNVINHLHKEDDNENVRVLEGDVDDITLDAEIDARAMGRSKSVRHFVISPSEALTDDQLNQAIEMIKDEFEFGDRPIYLVEHEKLRADGTMAPHYHLVTPETYGSGPELSSSHFMRRNEKLARKMEIEFGHEITKGRHNRAVQKAFEAEGNILAAEMMDELTQDAPALSKFGDKAHQKAKRLDANLPAISDALKSLQGASADEMAAGLDEISQNHGVNIDRGDRKNVILIKSQDGEILHNANRSLKIKAKQVDDILEKYRDIENGRADAEPRRIDPELRNEPTRTTRDDAPGTPGDDISDPGTGDPGGYWNAVEQQSGYEFDQTGYEPDLRNGDQTGRWRESDYDPVDRDRRDFDDIAASSASNSDSAVENAITDRPDPDQDSRRIWLTDEIQAAHAARQAQPVFDQLRQSLAAFITPADHLEANLGAEAAQSKFDELRQALAAFITPADRLEASQAAQDAQPIFDDLRASRMEFENREIIKNGQRATVDRSAEGPEVLDAASSRAIKTDESHAAPVEQSGSSDQAAASTAEGTQETGEVHGKSGDSGSSEPDVAAPGGGGTAFAGADVEPMPDLNDPQLMMKLSRMLAKSMAKQRTSSSGFMQNQKKRWEFLNSQKRKRSSRTENQRPTIDISDFMERRLRVLKIEDEGKKKGRFTEKQRTDLRLCMSSITVGYSDDDILRGLREHSENIKEFSENEIVDYLEDRLAVGHNFLVQKAIKRAEEKGEDIDWDGIRKDENERLKRVEQRAEARRHHERIQREAAEQRAELQRQKSKKDLAQIAKTASKMTRRQPKLKPRVQDVDHDDDVIDDLDQDQGYTGPRM